MVARAHLRRLIPAVMAAAIFLGGACDGAEESRRGQIRDRASGEGQPAGWDGSPGAGGRTEGTVLEAGMTLCRDGREEIRIGSFRRPGRVPAYETLEEQRADRGCVEAVRLLVDTRANDEAGYALIARDLKARYSRLDAITAEFTDTSGTFEYEGSALIFNTPSGAYFMGYAYGPPNNDGYHIAVSK